MIAMQGIIQSGKVIHNQLQSIIPNNLSAINPIPDNIKNCIPTMLL